MKFLEKKLNTINKVNLTEDVKRFTVNGGMWGFGPCSYGVVC